MYTPNLGLWIAFFDQEREQGRFKGSSGGAKGRSKDQRGSTGEHRGAWRSSEGAPGAKGRSTRVPKLAASQPAKVSSFEVNDI